MWRVLGSRKTGLCRQKPQMEWNIREGKLRNCSQSTETTLSEKFCHKQEPRCEVGAGEGGGVKQVLLKTGDGAACWLLSRMIQRERKMKDIRGTGGYPGAGEGVKCGLQMGGSSARSMKSPGPEQGEGRRHELRCS